MNKRRLQRIIKKTLKESSGVSNEQQYIDEIEMMLDDLDKILLSGARVAIISFHSLEDKIVKNYYSPKSLQ